ncbi:aminoacyl-tRNA hydrolase [Bacillus sp. HMF5848]|uniref:aminoacyl-tRNA hydrolase n=1 Tax=Bacillus sp. HMF5848 TaxID=2495421 RepID=UPI000F790209|nr:aminoacyl-tRNA hydrolase [Bacillus sp. HMF5848]RSK25487.1 aminoacyl-tRNA hydrolase [Bacillus sp. HMF5848]
MKLIVGLGNPGLQYKQTRHNVGFMVMDELASRLHTAFDKTNFKGIYAVANKNGEKVILLKPLTYMNLSGECVRPLLDYFKLELDDLVVVYDDLDLPAGKIRLRTKGSAGGHNGIKSLIQHLGTQEFKRVRVGIGRPEGRIPISDYVLSPFHKEEQALIQQAIDKSSEACLEWLETSYVEVMNKYNVQ